VSSENRQSGAAPASDSLPAEDVKPIVYWTSPDDPSGRIALHPDRAVVADSTPIVGQARKTNHRPAELRSRPPGACFLNSRRCLDGYEIQVV
jgi:hypothetical protein